MACVTHSCRECPYMWFNNWLAREQCPACGSWSTVSHCDEDNDRKPAYEEGQ